MISHDLERAVRSYLTAVTGALVRSADDPIIDDDGFSLVASPEGLPGYQSDGGLGILLDGDGVPLDGGLVFRFYVGEGNDRIELPCGIIHASGGAGEMDTGNETVDLTVTLRGPLYSYTYASDTFETVQEITEACINALFRTDVADYLNLYRGDAERLTVIGIADRGTTKTQVDAHLEHEIRMVAYCAGMNLDPTLPIQS